MEAWKLYDQCFTKVTKAFFYLITIFGFRPFPLPGESKKLWSFSLFGLIFSIPIAVLNAYILRHSYTTTVSTITYCGFFNGQTALSLMSFLSYSALEIYLTLSLFFSSKLGRLLEKFDILRLTEKSNKYFRIFYAVSIRVSLLFYMIHVLLSLISVMLSLQENGTINVHLYLSIINSVFSTAVLIFPLEFLSLLSFYLYRAFADMIDAFQSSTKSPIKTKLSSLYSEYLNLADMLELVDEFFSFVIGVVVCTSLLNVSLFLLNSREFEMIPAYVILPWMFLMAFNFFGYGIACTCINDKVGFHIFLAFWWMNQRNFQSRSVLSVLHRIESDDNSVHCLVSKIIWMLFSLYINAILPYTFLCSYLCSLFEYYHRVVNRYLFPRSFFMQFLPTKENNSPIIPLFENACQVKHNFFSSESLSPE